MNFGFRKSVAALDDLCGLRCVVFCYLSTWFDSCLLVPSESLPISIQEKQILKSAAFKNQFSTWILQLALIRNLLQKDKKTSVKNKFRKTKAFVLKYCDIMKKTP